MAKTIQQLTDELDAAVVKINAMEQSLVTKDAQIAGLLQDMLNVKSPTFLAYSVTTGLQTNTAIQSMFMEVLANLTNSALYIYPPKYIVTDPKANTCIINWEGIANVMQFEIYYKIVGTSNWKLVKTTANGITLTNLNSGANYEVYVVAVKNDGVKSRPSEHIIFQTIEIPQ